MHANELKTEVTYGNLIDILKTLTVPQKNSLIVQALLAKRFDERGKTYLAMVLLRNIEKTILFSSSKKCPKKLRLPEEDADKIIVIINKLINT